MPAIFHTKVVDDDFDGAVQHIIEAQPNDAVVWHCKNAEEGFDGAIFHVKWAEANFDGPVWRVVGIARVIEITLKGRSPLVLPNAILAPLASLIAFGGTEQRNLPDGYIQRQFIYMMDGSYLLTDIVPTYDSKIEFDFQTTSVPSGVFGGILGGRTITYGGLQVLTNYSSGAFVIDAFGTSSTDRYTSTVIAQNNTRYKFTFDNKVATLESGGSVLFTNTFTGTGATGAALALNAVNDGTIGVISNNNMGIYVYSFKAWNAQGVLVADYVPAIQKGTVPVVGFYDTVSKTFKTATAGTFAAGGEAVPTPDAPMDIVSNNGVLKARHQSGLPLGYTLLDYIESSGTQYIDTGIIANNSTGFYVDAQKLNTASDAIVIGSRESNSNTRCWVDIDHSNNGVLVFGWGDSKRSPNIIGTNRFQAFLNFMNSRNGIVDGQECPDFATLLQSSLPTQTRNLYLCKANYSGGDFPFVGKVYSVKISQNDTFARNFVPCKNASGVVGMYDTVSGQFFTNAGTGDFVAGNTVSDPVEVYADGVVETIGLYSANHSNLLAPNMIHQGTISGVNGAVAPASNRCYFDFIKVKAGDDVYFSTKNNTPPPYGRIFIYSDANENSFMTNTSGTAFSFGYYSGYKYTITADGYVRGLILQSENFTPEDVVDAQVVIQSATPTTYEPYYDGGTATAEMLLSIGDYTDEQEIISGVVTRKLGVKVLDGTEDWGTAANVVYTITKASINTDSTVLPSGSTNILCSHFKTGTGQIAEGIQIYAGTTNICFVHESRWANLTAFQSWLADQYAAGTPVIIVYPLATETTDTVTGQPMNTTAGDNILEITQASLDGLELEATYLSGVVVTIEEVENAQLSDNVEVTIQ